MSMSRKDYELIAEILATGMATTSLAGETPVPYAEGYEQAVRDMAATFAYRLAKTNERFDEARFLKAAGVTP
jgi:hypothetical protein